MKSPNKLHFVGQNAYLANDKNILFLYEVSDSGASGFRRETEVNMTHEFYVIEDGEDLLRWNRDENEVPELTTGEADFIVSESKAYDIELLTDTYGTLYARYDDEPFKITLADVIDELGSIFHIQLENYREAAAAADPNDSFRKFTDQIKELEEKEQRLDEVFEKTTLARQIRNRMCALAAKTYDQVRMIPIISNTIKDDGPVLKPAAFTADRPRKGMVM